jgi:hypothetical protein
MKYLDIVVINGSMDPPHHRKYRSLLASPTAAMATTIDRMERKQLIAGQPNP